MKRNLLAVALIATLSTTAHANIGETFGFGGQWGALAGAGVAGGSNPYSAYYNPATLAGDSPNRLQLGYGLFFANPVINPITNIVTQNNYNSSNAVGAPTIGSADTAYRQTLGQEVAFAYKLLPDWHNLSLGVVTFVPMTAVAYMDTGEMLMPEYFLYRSRTLRPQVDFGAGMELGGGFKVGVGGHLGYTLSSSANVFLGSSSGGTQTSTMRFIAALTPKVGPYLGAYYEPKDSHFSFGANFRFPVNSDATMALNTGAGVIAILPEIQMNFTATSALYYDPMALEVGGKWDYTSWGRLVAQVDYQFWSAFKAPFLLISNFTYTNQPTPLLAPGQDPGFSYTNIVVPRVGTEIHWGDNRVLRLSYAYRPSILNGNGSGNGNYIDPPKHMIQAGMGWQFRGLFGHDIAWGLDVNAGWHLLVGSHVTKSANNEAGTVGDSKVGAPGYDTGGSVFFGGASIALML